MTKNELLALANIGKTEIHGYPCEVKVYPSSVDGTPWLEIHFDPLSPLHQPLILGNLWVEYITEEDCAELPEALDRYKREADEFCREAKTIVKATLNADGTYNFTDVPEAVRANFPDYPSALRRWLNHKHYITPIKDDKEYWYAPGNFTLELDGVQYVPHWSYWLDGVQYVPHWSYWLDCAYYENTPIA